MGEGQCQENRPQKVPIVNPWENMNNPPQVQGDYNTRGFQGYQCVLRRAED